MADYAYPPTHQLRLNMTSGRIHLHTYPPVKTDYDPVTEYPNNQTIYPPDKTEYDQGQNV